MIVKVQLALYPPGAPALIYDERQTIMQQIEELPIEILHAMSPDKKAYFYATLDGSKKLHFGTRVFGQFHW